MMSKSFAVIGSAGREKPLRWSRDVYVKAYHRLEQLITEHCADAVLAKSGGAAWADHLLVTAVLQGFWPAERTELHIPCRFIQTVGGIAGYLDKGMIDPNQNPGGTLLYYHRIFTREMKRGGLKTSLHGIAKANQMGMRLIHEPYESAPAPLQARNLGVGDVDILFAFTWGESELRPKLTGGGTAHTWDHSRASKKIHIPLGSL